MQELHSPDGKVERVYADGRSIVQFANSAVKEQRPDGRVQTVFGNGDVKRLFPDGEAPCLLPLLKLLMLSSRAFEYQQHRLKSDMLSGHAGRLEYFYREADTWHTTHTNGTEVDDV